MYLIAGSFIAKEESKQKLVDMARDLIPNSLEEAGCVSYNFYEDKMKPGKFLFFEEWKTREAISEHFEKSYFKDFAERFPDMIIGDASIRIFQVSDVEHV